MEVEKFPNLESARWRPKTVVWGKGPGATQPTRRLQCESEVLSTQSTEGRGRSVFQLS